MKRFMTIRAPNEETWFAHMVTGFYISIFVITIITNTFLFTVFLKNKHFRDLSTYLIVQMAAADVLYLCVTCSTVAVQNLDISLSRAACKTLLYVEGSARFASSLSLMLISLERSASVCSPSLCYTIRKVPKVKEKVFGSVAITSLILRVGVLFVACDPAKWAPGYRLAVTICTYILPLMIEIIAYSVAYHKINRRIRNSSHSKQVLLFVKKSLKVFVVIAVVFAVCTLPSSILTILQSLHLYTPSFFVGYLADMIECVPCVTNVICYVLCSPKFRAEIKNLFSVCRPRIQETGVQDEDDGQEQDRVGHANAKLTLKLDWVLGDDPSHVTIPGSSPYIDAPLDIPSTVPEAPEFGLSTIVENGSTVEHEDAPPKTENSRRLKIGTWPRMRRLLYDGEQASEVNNSLESSMTGSPSFGLDSGVSKSSSVALESNLPRSTQPAVIQGTQTECSTMTVQAQEETSWL